MESDISNYETVVEKLISIVIPIHDKDGQQLNFLDEALKSIVEQSEQPTEVILSSMHEMQAQINLINKYKKILPIITIVNSSYNAPSNLNLVIPKCSSEFIKILFQDDLLQGRDYLKLCKSILSSEKNAWGLITTSVNFESDVSAVLKKQEPKFSVNMLKGKNLFGSPSVVFFRKDYFIPFQENLLYMYDCEWYIRMVHNWGNPILAKSLVTLIRIHQHQATNNVKELLSSESRKAEQIHSCTKINTYMFKYYRVPCKCKCKLESKPIHN